MGATERHGFLEGAAFSWKWTDVIYHVVRLDVNRQQGQDSESFSTCHLC
jgi:hypothetical protein